MNLTIEDVIALSGLTEEEIDAIAQHEHLTEIAAAELGTYLVHSDDGIPMIKRMILDDIEEAERHGDADEALKLKAVLKHFIDTHPHAEMYSR
jgi:hypothetical protein